MSTWAYGGTIALRDGLTASYFHEGPDASTRHHLILSGFDDSGRPFKVDIMGWPASPDADAVNDVRGRPDLNLLFDLIINETGASARCPACGTAPGEMSGR